MKKKSYVVRFAAFIVRPFSQVIILAISLGFILFFGNLTTRYFRPLEQRPNIQSITPAKIKEWGGDPTVVQVGLYINSWQEFDVVQNNFVFDGIIWFQFDPALISLDTVDKFSFEKGEILKKSEPDTKLIDGQLFVEYKIRLRFTSELVHKFFPLDDHRIYIVLVNTFITPGEMVFKVNKSTFISDENVFIPDWIQIDHEVKSGYQEQYIDKYDDRKVVRYPQVVFTIDFVRSGISLIFLIFVPIFIIFFISAFSLALDPRKESGKSIIALATGGLTAIIAYRFVIQGMAPKVGYFLFSDHIFTFFLILSFMNFLVSIIIMLHGKLSPMIIKIRGLLFISFHILFIVTWIYLLFFWIR